MPGRAVCVHRPAPHLRYDRAARRHGLWDAADGSQPARPRRVTMPALGVTRTASRPGRMPAMARAALVAAVPASALCCRRSPVQAGLRRRECVAKDLPGGGRADAGDRLPCRGTARACAPCRERRLPQPVRYILVNEFQDISPGRARLLKALPDRSPTTGLFAVSDDWQAVYRLVGSDIAIMRELEERFGESARIDLETPLRCADRSATVATIFVLSDPVQLRENVSSTRRADGPCVPIGPPSEECPDLPRDARAIRVCPRFAAKTPRDEAVEAESR